MIIHNAQVTGSLTVNGVDVTNITGSSTYASTGSNTFVGNQIISGSLTVTGSITGYISGSLVSGQIPYSTGTSTITGSTTLTYTPTTFLNVQNAITASSAVARGIFLRPTLTATANSDTLIGLDISSTNSVGAFTGIRRYSVRGNADLLINGVTLGRGPAGYIMNTTLGSDALSQFPTTGNRSTAVGYQTLQYLTTGDNNTALGAYSLNSVTTGAENISVGVYTLFNMTSGSQNTVVGNSSFTALTTGDRNTTLGYYAGAFAGTGSLSNFSSYNSLFLGYQTRASASGDTNEIVIGYDTVGLGSNTTVLGNSSTTFARIFGNLGLGTSTNSGFQLDVSGSSRLNGNTTVSGSLTVTGQIIAQTLNVQQVTSSIVYASGSNIFGNNASNTQQFTGSVSMANTLNVVGALTGSSALFNSSVTANGLISTNAANPTLNLVGTNSTAVPEIYLKRNTSTTVGYIGAGVNLSVDNVGDFVIVENRLSTGGIGLRTNGTTSFILSSTGAATFSSRVTANGGLSSAGGYATFQYNSAGTYPAYNTYFGAIGTNFSNSASELDIWNTVGGGFALRSQTGASSQTALLHIASTGAATFSSSVTATYFRGEFYSSTLQAGINFPNGNDVQFRLGNADGRVIFNSSGNIGIGVQPSAWWSNDKAIQIAGGALWAYTLNNYNVVVSANTYQNSSNNPTYISSASATQYLQDNGQHIWLTAPSGTAGNTISFTQTMTLDASGRLGIGTTSPVSPLNIEGNNADIINLRIKNNNISNGNKYLEFSVGGSTGFGVTNWANSGIIESAAGTNSNFVISNYEAGPIIFQNNGRTERMRITSAGNVGIGISNPSTYGLSGTHLDIFGGSLSFLHVTSNTVRSFLSTNESAALAALFTYSNHPLTFGTNNTERMRIQTDGAVVVKTSKAATILQVENSRNNSSGDYALVTVLGSNAINTNNYHFIATDNSVDRLYIYGNGNVVNTNGSYGTLSDIALKENIVDATPKLADLLNLKVRNFNLIGDTTKQIGFIAQEFEEVFPSMVDTDGKSGMKTIKSSVLVPMLVKAIQELKAENDTLKEILQRNNIQ